MKRESTPLGNQRVKVHTAEPASSNRSSGHHNQRGYVRGPEELTQNPGSEKGGGFRGNTLGASFSIWGIIR